MIFYSIYRPILHTAIEDERLEVVKHLVLSPTAKEYRFRGTEEAGKFTPLWELTDKSGWTPLHSACNKGHFEIVDFLLNNPTEPHPPDSMSVEMSTPLHYFVRHPMPPPTVISREKYYEILSALLGPVEGKANQPRNINLQNKNGDTPLHVAIKSGCSEIIMFLLLKQASVNAINKYDFLLPPPQNPNPV